MAAARRYAGDRAARKHRRCQVVEHVAAVREEHSVRRADAAIYWSTWPRRRCCWGSRASRSRGPICSRWRSRRPAARPAATPIRPAARSAWCSSGSGARRSGPGSMTASAPATGCTARLRWRWCRGLRRPATRRRCPRRSDDFELQLGQFHSPGGDRPPSRAAPAFSRYRDRKLWPPEPDEQTEEDGMAAQDVMNAQGVMNATRPPSRRWRGTLEHRPRVLVQVEVVLPYYETALTPNTGAAMSVAR